MSGMPAPGLDRVKRNWTNLVAASISVVSAYQYRQPAWELPWSHLGMVSRLDLLAWRQCSPGRDHVRICARGEQRCALLPPLTAIAEWRTTQPHTVADTKFKRLVVRSGILFHPQRAQFTMSESCLGRRELLPPRAGCRRPASVFQPVLPNSIRCTARVRPPCRVDYCPALIVQRDLRDRAIRANHSERQGLADTIPILFSDIAATRWRPICQA